MRVLFACLCLISLLFTSSVEAQSYSNDWINPSKSYVKIKISKDGVYRIKLADVNDGNISWSGAKGSDFKMYNLGIEQPLYVTTSGAFGPNDYIEFVGQRHTIGLDTMLYSDWKKDLFNTRYSMMSDTNVYFITLSPESNNLRYNTVNPDYATNNLPVAPYVIAEQATVYSETHHKTEEGSIRRSTYEAVEGYGSSIRATSTVPVNLTGLVISGPSPSLRIRYGSNAISNRLNIKWNDAILDEITSPSKVNVERTYELEMSQVKNENTLLCTNNLSANDRHRLAFVSVLYPRSPAYGATTNIVDFYMLPSTQRRYLEIEMAASGTVAYDVTNRTRYNTNIKNGKAQLLLNPITKQSRILIANTTSGVLTPDFISVFKPRRVDDAGAEYIIISNKELYGPNNVVQQYADYRGSAAGGGYKTDIFEVNEIYNNFGYGFDRHPMSIKAFSKFIDEKWSKAKFFMVLGKGLEYTYMRSASNVINNTNKTFFVPVFGFPGSDVLLFSNGDSHIPRLAVGRFAATTPTEISDYLDKIKVYEATPKLDQTIDNKLWTKKALHLGGGKTLPEQTQIRLGLEGFENIIKDTTYGGEIISYYKNSADAVTTIVNAEINDRFNEGIAMLNFFGHSANTTWDFSLQNPNSFTNKNKYPFISSFGCSSGNLHVPTKGISESFVIQKEKAAIAFLASTGSAFISDLSNYGNNFFSNALQKNRSKTIGEVLNITAAQANINSVTRLTLYHQLTYHGDPALRFYNEELPDYTFDYTSIKLNPKSIQSTTTNIKLNFSLINLGTHQKDTVDLNFYHLLPDGSAYDTITLSVVPTGAITEVNIELSNPGTKGIGTNKIVAIIDEKNNIEEGPKPQAESNNRLISNLGNDGYEFEINDNIAIPVYPPNYHMINTPNHFILRASTPSVPANPADFVVEIDTTRYFNSSLKESVKVTTVGGLIEYKPTKLPIKNKVYYWRVSTDSTAVKGYEWQNSSFAFLPDEAEGYNQSHFFQFTDDDKDQLMLSESTNRRLAFIFEQFGFKIKNKIYDNNDRPLFLKNNVNVGSIQRAFNYTGAGFVFNVYDHITGEIFNTPGGLYGSIPPGGDPFTSAFAFSSKTVEDRKKIIDFIDLMNTKNRTLVIMSALSNPSADMDIANWDTDQTTNGKTLWEVFDKMGAVLFKEFKNTGSVPYIFVSNNYNSIYTIIDEKISATKTDVLETDLITDVKLKNEGKITSTIVGPASQWGDLKFLISGAININEKNTVDVYGIKVDGTKERLFSELTQNTGLSTIDATKYPNLNLVSQFSDVDEATAADLNFWRISYIELPDLAVNIDEKRLPKDYSLQQGDKIILPYGVKNISSINIDSVNVRYTLTDENNNSRVLYAKVGKLLANNVMESQLEFASNLGVSGNVKIVIEVNYDQMPKEKYTFNNKVVYNVKVGADDKNPNLNVYFDGIQILDGDIVSPKPNIKITLKDDNTYFPITDINAFTVSLDTAFTLNSIKSIPLTSSDIKFTPATPQSLEARIEYTPTLRDGDYRLIVQGKDMTGNLSGKQSKIVAFRVISEESATQVLNYPNPFSTSTQFVFTLTGTQVPDQVSISIMTMSGKVVKEITKEQLGPLRIGINKSEYKWDGTDEYGERLANGVYLYKVNMRNASGEIIKNREEGKINDFFKNNTGKLVIMR
jgi:hypothetical protein